MLCLKCGKEMVNGRCEHCGYQEYQQDNNVTINYSNNISEQPQNAKTVKILGILSFFIPILSIVTLIMGKGYNKKNNYGGSSDIKVGKICAKIVVWITVITFTLSIILFSVGLIGTIVENKEVLDNLDKYSNSMIIEDPEYDDLIKEPEEITTQENEQELENNTTTKVYEDIISEEEALTIALKSCRLTKDDVTECSVELLDLQSSGYIGDDTEKYKEELQHKYYRVQFKEDNYNFRIWVNSVNGEIFYIKP